MWRAEDQPIIPSVAQLHHISPSGACAAPPGSRPDPKLRLAKLVRLGSSQFGIGTRRTELISRLTHFLHVSKQAGTPKATETGMGRRPLSNLQQHVRQMDCFFALAVAVSSVLRAKYRVSSRSPSDEAERDIYLPTLGYELHESTTSSSSSNNIKGYQTQPKSS